MFSKYDKWINTNKEQLIEQWENGITWFCYPIIEDNYEDFVAAMWKLECQYQK